MDRAGPGSVPAELLHHGLVAAAQATQFHLVIELTATAVKSGFNCIQ